MLNITSTEFFPVVWITISTANQVVYFFFCCSWCPWHSAYTGGERSLSTPFKTTMFVGCQGMYKTDTNTHQSTKKRVFFVKKLDCFVLKIVLHRQKEKKKNLVVPYCLYEVCSLLYWLVFTHPALANWIRMDTRGMRITEEESGLVLLNVTWKYILHAFHWATHTWTISASMCVTKSMPPDLRVQGWRGGLHCRWITGTCVRVGSKPKLCHFKKKREGNAFINEGTMGAF